MKAGKIWDFIVKYEFWFTIMPVIGLYIGEYLTHTHWMGNLAFLLFLIAITRLASILVRYEN